MNPDEFDSALADLGWKAADFTRKAGLVPNTAWRWRKGLSPVPEWVGLYLGAMLEIQRLHGRFVAVRGPARRAQHGRKDPSRSRMGCARSLSGSASTLARCLDQRLHARFVAVQRPVDGHAETPGADREATLQG